MRISFLHTIDGNRRVFEDAAKNFGLRSHDLRHLVRRDLREAVQQAGTLSAELKAETNRCLLGLAAESDAVIVTCATLGPVVDEIANSPIPILRADDALAAAAARVGGKITVLCAVESVIDSNRQLFEKHLNGGATSVEIVHVDHVWALFKSGDLGDCFTAIAESADKAYEAGATVVAFAHPWMAPAASLARGKRRPLDSAHVALRAVAQQHGAFVQHDEDDGRRK